VPCVTLREQTERPVTITHGTNRMTPWPLTSDGILSSFATARLVQRIEPGKRCPPGWDGEASRRIVDALLGTPVNCMA
jgi:UDP-N-acetylglucosamine 2-epimerase (non-hydrolysing)